jgi:hypothetical protein
MVRRLALLVPVLVLVLGACSGSGPGAATQGPGASPAGGGGGGGGGGASSSGPNATGGGSGTGSGTAIADPCAQVTVAEAAGAMGTDPLTAHPTPGDPAKCSYQLASGEETLVVTYVLEFAPNQYKAVVDAGSDEVPGIGDKARYVPGTRSLTFMVGKVLVTVFQRYVQSSDPSREITFAIGKIIAARMATGSVPPGLQITAPPVLKAKSACDLLSGDEAAGVIAKGPMTAKPNPSTPQFCTYALTSSGEELLSVYLDAKGGQSTWSSMTSTLETDPVSGLGDQALFESFTGILFVLKADSILNVNVYGLSPEETLPLDRKLMEIMLRHL